MIGALRVNTGIFDVRDGEAEPQERRVFDDKSRISFLLQ